MEELNSELNIKSQMVRSPSGLQFSYIHTFDNVLNQDLSASTPAVFSSNSPNGPINVLSSDESLILGSRYGDLAIQNPREVSYSMIVDNPRRKIEGYSSIQPRTIEVWTEDNAVTKCYCCSAEFKFLSLSQRRTHCRSCGGVFCRDCLHRKRVIPVYVKVPKPPVGKEFTLGKDSVKVCEDCSKKLDQLRNLEVLIKVFESVSDESLLTLDDYRNMRLVCKSWNYLSNFYLSKFRELQYHFHTQLFTKYEQNLLWINRKYFVGHSVWMVQLIHSVYQRAIISKKMEDELIDLLAEHDAILKKEKGKYQTCRQLMCTRDCSIRFSISNIVSLLHRRIQSIPIRRYAVNMLNYVSQEELQCYLPYLCYSVQFDGVTDIIGTFLLDKCCTDAVLASEIYWQYQILIENKNERIRSVYKYWVDKFNMHVPQDIQFAILKRSKLQRCLNKCYPENIKSISKKRLQQKVEARLTKISDDIKYTDPISVHTNSYTLNTQRVTVKSSITKPIVLQYIDKSYRISKILYKKEDLRKDYIIMSVIRLVKYILKEKEKLDLNILTYDILPTSSSDGFIEIVQNCETLYTIKERKKFSLLNYLIEKNPNGNIIEIRKNFLKSSAAYCIISYLLGIGDRHLENIMMTNDGALFHIDYGFVLGQDPKYMTLPAMRISDDMIDALGGLESRDFYIFKELCDRIYNCLRRHIHYFMPLLLLLSDLEPPIIDNGRFTKDQIVNEICRRFAPGESYQEAKLHINNRIDNSTKTLSYAYWVDFWHYHNRENTIGKFFSETYNTLSSFFKEN